MTEFTVKNDEGESLTFLLENEFFSKYRAEEEGTYEMKIIGVHWTPNEQETEISDERKEEIILDILRNKTYVEPDKREVTNLFAYIKDVGLSPELLARQIIRELTDEVNK